VSARLDRVVSVVLSAGILGLVTSPLFFIFSGVLFAFSPMFSLVTLPPLVLGVGYLLRRFVAGPREPWVRRPLTSGLEALSFLVIGMFLVLVSQVNLTVGFERLGIVCTSFLVAWALCLPIVSLRRTAIEQRVAQLPKAVAVTSVLLTFAATSLIAFKYLTAAPTFIG
jgi:hypothetical protein